MDWTIKCDKNNSNDVTPATSDLSLIPLDFSMTIVKEVSNILMEKIILKKLY